jgi:hypothetical protein
MTQRITIAALAALFGSALLQQTGASAQVPTAVAEPDATIVAIYHAEGAQIYECSLDAERRLTWHFREPIATLIDQGSTIGRHFAGPSWALTDGSGIIGKVIGSAPGQTPNDIPWLKLAVVNHRGAGKLTQVDIVQRINTNGGVASGPCDDAGMFLSMPYSADYSFLHRD